VTEFSFDILAVEVDVVDEDVSHRACQNVLSVETHRRAATGNTRSREAPGTTGGPRSLGQRPRIWHTTRRLDLLGMPPDLYLIRKV
jgi:hypothetical protein